MLSMLEYRREIDGLRALAVVVVVLYHVGFDLFNGGFVGVDVFFVISGYLITTIIIRDLKSDSFTLRKFYAKRARRILPALFLVVSVSVPFAWFWLTANEMRDWAESVLATVLFGSNILFWRESGYFDLASLQKPLLHTWSLGVEEQFYLLFPVLLLLLFRRGMKWVVIATALAALTSVIISQWASVNAPVAGYFLLPSRFWELALGSMAAFYLMRPDHKPDNRLLAEAGGWSGLGLIGYAVLTFDSTTPFPGLFALFPAAGATLIIVFSGQSTSVGKLLGSTVFVFTGLLSYSIYLWHYPAIVFSRKIWPEADSFTNTLILLPLIAFLSFLTWKYVELPFRKRDGVSTARSLKFASGIAIMLVLIAIAGVGSDGFKRPERGGNAALNPETISDEDFIVIGDSHAAHLVSGLTQLTSGVVDDRSANGCIPLRNIDRYDSRVSPGKCSNFMNSELDRLIASDPEATIIISSMGPTYLDGTRFKIPNSRVDGNRVVLVDKPDITDSYEIFELGLRTTFGELTAMERSEVIFAIDIPELGIADGCVDGSKQILLGDFLIEDFLVPSSEPCAVDRDDYDQRTERYRTLVYSVAKDFPRIKVFDPTPVFCDNMQCVGVDPDGRNLYRDQDHLSPIGSLLVARAIMGEFFPG